MNRPGRGELRSDSAAAAVIFVALGLGGLIAQHFGDLACSMELILEPFVAAARVASVTIAAALIVAGVVLIGRDQ